MQCTRRIFVRLPYSLWSRKLDRKRDRRGREGDMKTFTDIRVSKKIIRNYILDI